MIDDMEKTRRSWVRTWLPDAAIVAVLLLTAVVVFRWDGAASSTAQDWFQQHAKPAVPTFVIEPFRLLGKTDVVWFFVLFLCWATGNRRLLWRFACAAVPSALFVLLVKVIVARPRPTGHSIVSFPSGDSSIAFVWAAVLAAEYPILAVPAFMAAATIALLRVAYGLHYPSDVLAGSAIGFAAARIAVHLAQTVPTWLYRATQRLRWGLIMVGGFAAYVAARAIFEKRWILVLAAAVVPLILCVTAIAKRKVYARLLRKRGPPGA